MENPLCRKLHNLSAEIETVMTEEPPARNCDIYLMRRVWQRFYGVGDLLDLNVLYELPMQDSIKRLRAMIQGERRLVPTDPEVAKHRRMAEEVWRNVVSREGKT